MSEVLDGKINADITASDHVAAADSLDAQTRAVMINEINMLHAADQQGSS
jgi:hypothetical protein